MANGTDIRASMFDQVPNQPENIKFPHFPSWEIAEANYWGMEQANRVNFGLREWEESKWKMIYRLVFPEEAPWNRIRAENKTTHSRYDWNKLIVRLHELLLTSGRTPAEDWRTNQGDGSEDGAGEEQHGKR